MKTASVLLVAVFVFSFSVFGSEDDVPLNPWEVPYKSTPTRRGRMDMVIELGEKYGLKNHFCQKPPTALVKYLPESARVGILGGILLNTHRQAETHRDSLAIWSIPNSSLTVEPYEYMKEFEQGISCKDSRYIHAIGRAEVHYSKTTIDRYGICSAWRNFFEASKKMSEQDEPTSAQGLRVQRLLWKAHSHSLFHVWALHKVQFEKLLAEDKISKKEYKQWNAWNQVVGLFLPRLNWDSCSDSMWPYLDIAIPRCLTLSSQDNAFQKICIEDDPARSDDEFYPTRLFVKQLIKGLSSTELDQSIRNIEYDLSDDKDNDSIDEN